jgi:hypothetical protein
MSDQEDIQMTVRRAENSGTPAPVDQSITKKTDGASPTQAKGKTEYAFSKDMFESPGSVANVCCNGDHYSAAFTAAKSKMQQDE